MVDDHVILDASAPEIALKSLFSKYDTNGDGKLDKQELSRLFKYDLGLSPAQTEVYQYILDKDGDSVVSYEEFREWIRSKEQLQNIKNETRYHYLQHAIEMFQTYDVDGNYSLDRSELKQLLVDSGGKLENIDVAMEDLDQDKNDRISFQEFLKWLNWAPLLNLFSPMEWFKHHLLKLLGGFTIHHLIFYFILIDMSRLAYSVNMYEQ